MDAAAMFVNILLSIAMLVALLIPGFILRKLKKVSDGAIPSLIAILLFVNQPFLLVKAFLYDGSSGLDPTNGDFLLSLLYVFVLSIVIQIVMFGVMKLCLSRIRPIERSRAYLYTDA